MLISKKLWMVLSGLALVMGACGNDTGPTGPGTSDNDFATVIIKTIDDGGNPVPEVGLSVSYDGGDTEFYDVSDANGMVIIDSLYTEEILVTTNISQIVGDYNYIHYCYQETLQAGHSYEFICMFPQNPVPVTVQAYEYRQNQYVSMPDVAITLDLIQLDDPYQVTTDSNGHATIVQAEPQKLNIMYNDLLLTRNGLTAYGRGAFTYEKGSLLLTLYAQTDPYLPKIVSPDDGSKQVSSGTSFSAEGYDFEDGELPDEAFVWVSDRDGEFATGRHTTADLSIGPHEITLKTTDSCGGSALTSVNIIVSHFDGDSCFPLPTYGFWEYRLEPISFSLTNEWGETEHWNLERMTVTSDSFDSRSCLMNWTVEKDGVTVFSRYYCDEQLSFSDGGIYIISTEEQLTVYTEPGQFASPQEDLKITTTYSPEYLLLNDLTEPSGSTGITVAANSNVMHTIYGVGSHTYIQKDTLSISYDFDSPVMVTTPLGTYDAIPMKTTAGSSERTLYLAPGIGVAQLDMDIAGTPVTASLAETNMESFVPETAVTRMMHDVYEIPSEFGAIPSDDSIRDTCRILRSLCPF